MRRFLGPALVAAATLAVFGQSLGFPLVQWDDHVFIVDNPLVRAPFAEGTVGLLTTPRLGYPAPVTVLSWHLDWRLGGGAPWPFHAANLAYHAAAVALFAAVLGTYSLGAAGRLAATLLFAIHPVVAEPVCWATGRKDLLATAFVLAGFLAWRRWVLGDRPRLGAAAVVAAYLLALGSKPSAIVLPALIALDLWVRGGRPAPAERRVLALTIPLGVAYVPLAYGLLGGVGALKADTPPLAHAQFFTQHLGLQLRNWVLPLWLSPKYLELPGSFGSVPGLVGLAATVAVAGLGVRAWRAPRPKPWALGLGWFLLGFAPVWGFVSHNRGAADSYLYLPGLGLALLGGLAVERLRGRLPLARLLAGLGALVLAWLAFVQAGVWARSSLLWRTVRDHYPAQRMAWWAYADALAFEGKPRAAVAVYEDAMTRFPYPPERADVLVSMARGCELAGDLPCAVRWLGEAIRHFGPEPERARRFLALYERAPDPAYAAELRRARGE